MVDFKKIQLVKQALFVKQAALMNFGEEQPGDVGLTSDEIQPCDQVDSTDEQEVSSHGQGAGSGVSGNNDIQGEYKAKSTKITSVKKDDNPSVMKVTTSTTSGPIGGDFAGTKDSPTTVEVGKDSVESLGNILNILKQLRFG